MPPIRQTRRQHRARDTNSTESGSSLAYSPQPRLRPRPAARRIGQVRRWTPVNGPTGDTTEEDDGSCPSPSPRSSQSTLEELRAAEALLSFRRHAELTAQLEQSTDEAREAADILVALSNAEAAIQSEQSSQEARQAAQNLLLLHRDDAILTGQQTAEQKTEEDRVAAARLLLLHRDMMTREQRQMYNEVEQSLIANGAL